MTFVKGGGIGPRTSFPERRITLTTSIRPGLAPASVRGLLGKLVTSELIEQFSDGLHRLDYLSDRPSGGLKL